MHDYTVVVTYLDGDYKMFSSEDGNGFRTPIHALQAFFLQNPENVKEILHVEIVDADNEFEVYNRCEKIGEELRDLKHYDEIFAAKLFPEKFPDIEQVIATVRPERPTFRLLRGGKSE